MTRLGTISFQSNDKADVFLVADVIEPGVSESDESLMQVEDVQFDSSYAWATGNVPQMTPVNIAGDNTVLRLWFRGENYTDPFVIRVYVEVEEAEELVSVEDDRKEQSEDQDNEETEIII